MKNRSPIKIDLIGFNQRARDTLAMVMSGPAKSICQLSVDRSSVAAIIDLDAVGALGQWEKYRKENPRHFSIVLSVKGGNIEHADEVLIKPINIPEFCSAMNRVAEKVSRSLLEKSVQSNLEPEILTTANLVVTDFPIELQSSAESKVQRVPVLTQDLNMSVTMELKVFPIRTEEFKAVCGEAADIDIENKAHVSNLFMSVDNRLLGAVLKAQKEAEHRQETMLIRFKSVPLFLLIPKTNIVCSTIKDDLLQRFCAKTFPEGSLKIEAVTSPPPEMNNSSSETSASFLWKSAAWTYCGKLPANTNLQERVFIRHWPNLSRLLELPDAMRISALLVGDYPMTLTGIAEALAIPQRHVFAYFSAAHSIGLIGVAHRSSDLLIKQSVKLPEQNNRMLLGRMIGHLRRILL